MPTPNDTVVDVHVFDVAEIAAVVVVCEVISPTYPLTQVASPQGGGVPPHFVRLYHLVLLPTSCYSIEGGILHEIFLFSFILGNVIHFATAENTI
jgi:hypothetical protein